MSIVTASALERVIERVLEAKSAGETPVVVFDVDDTLFSTKNRHVRILREFAETRPTLVSLKSIAPEMLRYTVTETAKQAGVTDGVILAALNTYWEDRFFRNEYLGEDAPVAGAPAYVRSILEAGAVVVYLTGRDETMRDGTVKAFETAGFPAAEGEQVRLVLKPRFDDKDLDFKRDAFERIAAFGAVVAGFENEPSYLAAMLDRFPRMTAVLLQTQHSGRPFEERPEILLAKDFAF